MGHACLIAGLYRICVSHSPITWDMFVSYLCSHALYVRAMPYSMDRMHFKLGRFLRDVLKAMCPECVGMWGLG